MLNDTYGFLEHDPDCPTSSMVYREIQGDKTQTNVMKLVGREGERA